MSFAKRISACVILIAVSGSFTYSAENDKKDAPAAGPKYNMSKFKGIAEEALKLVKAGDFPAASKKTLELESTFDQETKALRAADRKVWKTIDVQMDVAIEACKGAKPDATKATNELNKFIENLSLAENLK